MSDFGNKEIYSPYYNDKTPLIGKNGQLIELTDKTDEQIKSLLETHYYAQQYTGPSLKEEKKEDKGETSPEEQILMATGEKFQETFARRKNALLNAGISNEDIDLILPNPAINDESRPDLYDPKRYQMQLENFKNFNANFGMERTGLRTFSDIASLIQRGLTAPIRNFPATGMTDDQGQPMPGATFMDAAGQIKEMLPDAVVETGGAVKDFIEDYTFLGIDNTYQKMSERPERYGFPETFNYPAEVYQKIFSGEDYVPDPDNAPFVIKKTGQTFTEKLGTFGFENTAFALPFLKYSYSVSGRYADEFAEFLSKKAQKDDKNLDAEFIAGIGLDDANKLVSEFFATKGYKGGPLTFLHRMFLEPRLKTGLSMEQNAKNFEIFKEVNIRIDKNIIKRNELIKNNAPESQVKAVSDAIEKDRKDLVGLFVESVPKFAKTESLAIAGMSYGGAYFEEHNLPGGRFVGEISGLIGAPTGFPVAVNVAKLVNNQIANGFDTAYRTFPLLDKFPILGGRGTRQTVEQGLMIMKDPSSLGDPRLGIPVGYRQASDREVKAYNDLFKGLTQNLEPSAKQAVIANLRQTIDDMQVIEQYLIKQGMNEDEAYNVTSRALAISAQVPAIQHLALVNSISLKPNDFLDFSNTVAKHTNAYFETATLQNELVKIIDKLAPYNKNQDIKVLSDALTSMKAQNQSFVAGMEMQLKEIATYMARDLVRTDSQPINSQSFETLKALEDVPGVGNLVELIRKEMNLVDTLVTNYQTNARALSDALLDDNKLTIAQNKIDINLFNYLNKRKDLLKLTWDAEYRTPLIEALKDQGIVDFKPFLNTIEDSIPTLSVGNINKKIAGSEGALQLYPSIKHIKNIHNSLEEAAAKSLNDFFEPNGVSLKLLVEEAQSAMNLRRPPTFLEIFKFLDGNTVESLNSQRIFFPAEKVFNGKLELNFKDTHNIKRYINDVIDTNINSNNRGAAGVFFEIRKDLKAEIDTFFNAQSEEVGELYNAYNSYYKVNIGDVYTNKRGTTPLGASLVIIGTRGSENVPLTRNNESFYSLEKLTANNISARGNYKIELANLYGVDAGNIADSHKGKVFLDLGDMVQTGMANVSKEDLLASQGFQLLKEAVNVEAKKYILANTDIGQAMLKNVTDKNVIDEINKFKVDNVASKLNQLESRSVIFVKKADGTIVQESLVDVNKLLDSINIESVYNKFVNQRKAIDDIVEKQNVEINLAKDRIAQTGELKDYARKVKIFMDAYQTKFGGPFTSTEQFYKRYINNPELLLELKRDLTQGGIIRSDFATNAPDKLRIEAGEAVLSVSEFDEIVKNVMLGGLALEIGAGRDLTETIVRKLSGSKIETIKEVILNPFKSGKYIKSTLVPKDQGVLDIATLRKRLTENPVFREIMDEESFDLLIRLTNMLEKDVIGLGGSSRVEGLARGLSIPSLQSRVYNVIRGIISPQYVFGEVAFTRFRKGRQAFITELLTNKEAARNLIKILDSDSPLPEQEYRKFMGVVFSDLIAPTLGKHLLIEEGEIGENTSNMLEQMESLLGFN